MAPDPRPFAAAERRMMAQGERSLLLVTQLRPLVNAIAKALLALDLRLAALEAMAATRAEDEFHPLNTPVKEASHDA